MSDNSIARRAHIILERLTESPDAQSVHKEDLELLRSLLPEKPKQKTLEEVTSQVLNAWKACSFGYQGSGNSYNPEIPLRDWLYELHAQLEGLGDVRLPALPEGMRLADHEEYGRCVVSPKTVFDEYKILRLDSDYASGTYHDFVTPDSLTFIDTEPAKPSHPEFLETVEDYMNAPIGTIVALDKSTVPMMKEQGWPGTMKLARRRVLRWGDGA